MIKKICFLVLCLCLITSCSKPVWEKLDKINENNVYSFYISEDEVIKALQSTKTSDENTKENYNGLTKDQIKEIEDTNKNYQNLKNKYILFYFNNLEDNIPSKMYYSIQSDININKNKFKPINVSYNKVGPSLQFYINDIPFTIIQKKDNHQLYVSDLLGGFSKKINEIK
ncbi:MAG: hypothetical protein LBR15_02475 [Methanobrevibacter sp.]|jgi:hypothetical protein|nr:hypothetical protein [Candidatus Methanovirga australis]